MEGVVVVSAERVQVSRTVLLRQTAFFQVPSLYTLPGALRVVSELSRQKTSILRATRLARRDDFASHGHRDDKGHLPLTALDRLALSLF